MKVFYCDGSTRGGKNQKGADNIGGWGAVCFSSEEELSLDAFEYDTETNTTNNRQELKSLLWCLCYINDFLPNEKCVIYSDSAYVVNMCQDWIFKWAANGWKNSKKQLVENIDLVKEIWNYISKPFPNYSVKKCSGHSGNTGNELADALATGQKEKFYNMCNYYNVSLPGEEGQY